MEREKPNVRVTGELVKRLQEAKVVNLDVPIGELIRATAEQTGMEEVAGYVFAWDKYVFIVKGIEEEIVQ